MAFSSPPPNAGYLRRGLSPLMLAAMDPFRTPDAPARDLSQRLLGSMRHATLAVIDPNTGFPHVSRIACQADEDGVPMALLSDLARHSRALHRDPRAGMLIDPALPPAKGDPLTQARLSLRVRAQTVQRTPARRAHWLAQHPRAAIFIDLPDFRFWRLVVQDGLLNAGFGAAYKLEPGDMRLPPPD